MGGGVKFACHNLCLLGLKNLPLREFPFTDMCSPFTHLVPVETEMISASSIQTSLQLNVYNKCNGWDVWWNGTTSVPKSALRYVVDKVKLYMGV